MGEEYGTQAGDAATRWYIDPIDGTHDVIRGVPLFGTLLAVEHEGELQVGVISAPAMHERWFAGRGLGAWNCGLDGERQLHVSRVNRLEDAQIVYGSRRETVASGLMPGFDALISAAWRERGFGDFWGYALVAEGAAEAMLETGTSQLGHRGTDGSDRGGRRPRHRRQRRPASGRRRRSWARTGICTTRCVGGCAPG